MPTFVIFKNGRSIQTIKGADPKQLSGAVKKLANEAEAAGEGGNGGFAESSGSSSWMAAEPAKGYSNITEEVDIKGLELLNFDSGFGNVRTLFDSTKPSALRDGKGTTKDWVESDTDDQLMLYIPFQSTLKIHSLQFTSIPPNADDDDDEVPMRPKTVKIYTNRSYILGFEEAEDIPPTQSITVEPRDWDAKTGTAKIELRFVKFQNVSSLVIFVVNGDGDGDKVRIDRVRIVGESGEKRDPGKLEKVGEDHD
jgi:PITH domain